MVRALVGLSTMTRVLTTGEDEYPSNLYRTNMRAA